MAYTATLVIGDQLGVWNAPTSIMPDTIDLPLFAVTPEKIFANEVPFLNVNIINPKTYYSNSGTKIETPTKTLQSEISGWYLALRNLALVAMLSILVYIGIKIIISSSSTDKAKYKNFIKDWLVAICLLFFMHYIMSFAITMVEELTKSLKGSISVPVMIIDVSKYKNISGDVFTTLTEIDSKSGGSGDLTQLHFFTDFTGLARFRAQLDYDSDSSNYVAEGGKARMSYTIIYAVLVIYTVMFVFQYLKRLIYIIFLTMVAPLVAMTYPIDKMNDGSAQAFNMWFKEYIFNLLIQPFHLLLYSMLIGSSIQLASEHMLYALAVLGFMLPAEKILRKFFGFEKASAGSPFLGGAVGGALAMNAMNAISNTVKGGAKKSISGGSKGGSEEGDKVRWENRTSSNNAEEESNFLMDALGGPTDDENNIPNENNVPDDTELREQEEMQKLKDYFDNESNEDAYINPEEYQRNLDRYNELENKQKQPEPQLEVEEEPKDSNKATSATNTNAIKGPSRKKVKFSMKAAAPMVGRGALNLGKGVAKAYGAAALGTIGVAAGLASEDYGNVLKYGAAGATAGTSLTGAVINKGKDLPSNIYRKATNIKDEYVKNYYKDDPAAYKEYMNEQSDMAFMKDKNVQQLYKDKFGEREVDDGKGRKVKEYQLAMEKAKKYREHGITDNDVIIKAMKANVKGVNKDWDSKQRIAAAKYANQVSNEKDIESMSKRLKDRGIRQEQINAQEDMLRQIRGLN